ncbi:MAG: NADH-quinone oxidoreductase subunit D [Cyanobacteria bacterium HKST-UBA04]|nr:NADH-quinone oxidoreductase subunit D [Cyanobacteria bacterium HKST-UBA04]
MATEQPTQSLPQGVYLEKDIDAGELTVNIGPQHPSTHGVLRLITTIDGEVVRDIEPVIGYLHRSKEKMAESRSLFQYQPTIDRVEYLSAFFDHYVFVTSLEQIAGLKVPKRMQYVRMITMELNRIASHLLWFGTFLLDLGATSPMFYAFRDREKIFSLFEQLTGARMMYNYYRFGGANADMPEGWLEGALDFCDDFEQRIDEYEAIVTKNPIFLDRTVGVGVVDAETLIAHGVTGPTLRGSGVALDQRKDNPYCCYDEVTFDVPVGQNGDCYDRYLVRMAEMRESLKIIRQAVRQIPGGDTADLMRRRAEGDEAANDIELQIAGQKINLLTYKAPPGEVMTTVESPRGFLGCYLITDGTPKAYRCKWRGASFSNLTVLPLLMKGRLFPDLMAIFGSIDVILPEVDR